MIIVESFSPTTKLWTYSLVDLKNGTQVYRGALNKINYPMIGGSRSWSDPQKPGIFWFGRFDGSLIYFDLNQLRETTDLKPPVIRFVRGTGGRTLGSPVFTQINDIKMPFEENQIEFCFSLTDFDGYKDHRFQWKLEGLDREWSSWSKENKISYSFLPFGKYIFHLRAVDAYHRIRPPIKYEVIIGPPWYHTKFAYLCMALLASLFIWTIIKLRFRRLESDRQRLKQLVEEKTTEIKSQADKLKDLDRLKSHFFANISHEFRTPLSLILGPLENTLMQHDLLDEREMSIMHRNAKRLQRLIDQLLELSKLESGNLHLQIVKHDVIRFLRLIGASFSSLADHRKIEFQVDLEPQAYEGYFDSDKLEKVIYNLLSNAFKFTDSGGMIHLTGRINNDILEVMVQDNGKGIAQEELEYIFDRFYQSEIQSKSEVQGTGMGLALTKGVIRITQRHHFCG